MLNLKTATIEELEHLKLDIVQELRRRAYSPNDYQGFPYIWNPSMNDMKVKGDIELDPDFCWTSTTATSTSQDGREIHSRTIKEPIYNFTCESDNKNDAIKYTNLQK